MSSEGPESVSSNSGKNQLGMQTEQRGGALDGEAQQ